MIRNEKNRISEKQLSELKAYYKKGLFLKAYNEAVNIAPLKTWSGCEEIILAGQLAYNLGAPRFSRICFWRAYREYPSSLNAYVLHLNELHKYYGPVAAWQFLNDYPVPSSNGDDDSLIFLRTSRAFIISQFRDFDTAEHFLAQAKELNPDHPLTLIAQSNLLELKDCYEKALEPAQRVYNENPCFLPGIHFYVHKLLLLDRREEAHDILIKSKERMESCQIHLLLVAVEMECGYYHKALSHLNQLTSFIPLIEKNLKKFLVEIEISLQYLCGNFDKAIYLAEEDDDNRHDFIQSLSAHKEIKRIKLDVRFVRQHYKTCAPATISALSDYWEKPVGQLEIIESICYNGTPSYKILDWAKDNGWYVQSFTLTWDIIIKLINLGIPIGISIVFPGMGHFQAITGYDLNKKTILIRDPFAYFTSEVNAEEYLGHFKATGPRGTLLLPLEKTHLIKGIKLPDASYYDFLYEVHSSLAQHHRKKAAQAIEKLNRMSESHYITLTARSALAGYDANIPALLVVLEQYIRQFPDDPFLLHLKLNCLHDMGRFSEKMEILSDLCKKPDKKPVFWSAYAQEIMKDIRKKDEALYWLKKALRYLRNEARDITQMGHLFWLERKYKEAIELFRFASCLEDKNELYIQNYFYASRYIKQTDKVIDYLKRRVERYGKKSVDPAISLINSYRALDQTDNAFKVLEEQLVLHPDNGNLLQYAAHCYASYGRYKKAEEYLEKARGKTQDKAWLYMAAKLAGYKSEKKQAMALWQEIIDLEPLSIEAHSTLALLYAETGGKTAAFKYLEEICSRFPYHFGLHKLRISWLNDEQPDTVESICKHLLESYDYDAWIHSMLALSLCKQRRLEEAEKTIKHALALEASNPDYYALAGDIYAYQDKQEKAKTAYKRAILLQVDTPAAIHGLMNSCKDLEEKKESLAFIEQQLIKQTVFGDGLIAFYKVAKGIIAPEKLLDSLYFAYQERPDLWHTWSILGYHLICVHKLDEAEQLCLKATDQFPLNPIVWLDLARVKQFKKDLDGEIQAVTRAREINPALSAASQRLAQLFERKGEIQRARTIMENACAATPLDAVNYGYLANLLHASGESKEALYKLRRAILLDPGYRWAWQTIFRWAYELREMDFVIKIAEQLVEQRKGDPQIWVLLAESYFYIGENIKALNAIDKAIALDPLCVNAYDLKAQNLTFCKKYEEAIECCSLPGMEIRKAWIEAQRGCKKRAVELLQQVLAKTPEAEAGWSLLLAYLLELKLYEQLDAACRKMMVLFPFNALSYQYLGTLYLYNDCKEKAKEFYLKAYTLSPSEINLGMKLFDLELESGDLVRAETTLDILKQYLGSKNEYFLARKALLLIKKKSYSRAGDIFHYLCLKPIEDPWPLKAISNAFDEQGLNRVVYKIVKRVVRENEYRVEYNRHTGPIWVRHNAQQNKWFYLKKLKKVYNYSGAPTIIAYVTELGKAVKRMLEKPAFFSLQKCKFLLKSIYKRYFFVLKDHRESCGELGESLLLCGLIDPAIDVLRQWIDRNMDYISIVYHFAAALYLKGSISRAHHISKAVCKNNNNTIIETEYGNLSLLDFLHILIRKEREIHPDILEEFIYEDLSPGEKVVYNIVHFLIRKQNYRLLKKNRVISGYIADFPEKLYMINILKYLSQKRT